MTINILSKGIEMQNCVGQAVRGDNFWDREDEIDDIWDAIKTGSHILLAAPRRVGKTSIMFHLEDNPHDGYAVVYVNTESADSENEFWHKLFNALMDEDFLSRTQKLSKSIGNIIFNVRIKKVSTSGVEFGDGEIINYEKAFERLVKDINIDNKLIVMIDEFAQTVENIIKYDSNKSAEHFLQVMRDLRHNRKVTDKVSFVYAGSIGLESVVAKIHATKSINDLNSIKVSPLLKEDALPFAKALAKDIDLDIDKDAIDYMLDKIEWLIPFYIQLIIQEIKTLKRAKKIAKILPEHVDIALNKALEHKNHFEHWRSKIKEAFDNNSYLFAKEVLNAISENTIMSSSDIANISSKHNMEEDDAKEVIHSLEYDGYINNNDNVKEYRFNSPILRMWWNKNVAN